MFNVYPMPKIDEILDNIRQSQYLIMLDLTKATGWFQLKKQTKKRQLSLAH